MIFKINRSSNTFIIAVLVLFLPGHFGLYSPYLDGSNHDVPLWANGIISLIVIFTVGLAIRSFYYSLEITDAGITQKTIRSGNWSVKWQEIQGWSYSCNTSANNICIELQSDNKRKEILSGFLEGRNFPLIMAELERRLGAPIQSK